VEPLKPSTLPGSPWSRLGADIFEFKKKHYLLVVDYYSRYIEVRRLKSLSSLTTIEKLKSIFVTHGNPDIMISDNGPQFASREFYEFTETYGFQHVTSSPRYPQSNGEAERAVGTVKRMWEKSSDPHMSLMIYKATPLENGFTPSELLMGRLIRTNLPTLPSQRELQKSTESVQTKEESIRQRAIANHARRHQARELPELRPRSDVWIRDMGREGTVLEKTAPRSYNVQTDKGVIRRNRSALVATDGKEGKGSQVLQTPKSPTAHSSGVSRLYSAEGTGPPLTQSASCTVSGKVSGARREQRVRRPPKFLTENYVPY
jgi:hypothetical protein